MNAPSCLPRLIRTMLLPLGSMALGNDVHAELIDIAWNAGGQFERQLPVPAGKFAEVCGKLSRGTRVAWSFDADSALDFNIHYHEGKELIFPAKQENIEHAQGDLAVTATQDYCWMWTNRSGSAIHMKFALRK